MILVLFEDASQPILRALLLFGRRRTRGPGVNAPRLQPITDLNPFRGADAEWDEVVVKEYPWAWE
jgi:hypothetical protein